MLTIKKIIAVVFLYIATAIVPFIIVSHLFFSMLYIPLMIKLNLVYVSNILYIIEFGLALWYFIGKGRKEITELVESNLSEGFVDEENFTKN